MKKSIIIPILFLSLVAQAQQNFVYLNWDINVPTSNTDWVESTSPGGGKAGYRIFLSDNRFSVGGDFGWTTFDQYEPTKTFKNSTGAITTDYFKYIYQYSITASGQYYFKIGDRDRLFPYAGLGLGAMHNEYMIYYNIYSEGNASWGFLARPEVGMIVRIPGRRSLGAMAAIHYDISTNQSEEYDYESFSSFGFQVGIVIMSRY